MRAARGAALAVVGIVALSAALRVAVASLSPVLSYLTEEIDVPSSVVGLIGAAPPVSFAVFGILAPVFARRVRLETLAVIAAAVSAVGLVARAFAGDAASLLTMTLVAFAGIGVGNVILPALIKKYFPDAIGAMTTVYIATMSLAIFVPPVVAVPIAASAGWRFSLGVWAVVGVVAVVPWVALLVRQRRSAAEPALEVADTAMLGRLLRLPMTWALIGGMVVTASTVYALFAWLPAMLQERSGVDAATAGVLLGVFGGMGLPFALVIPFIVERFGAVRSLFLGTTVPGLAGVAGMLWAPTSAPWLWVLLLSLPTAMFPLVMVLVGLRTRSHTTTIALSAAVQSIGYSVAALFPVVMGAMHEGTRGWESSLWLLAALFALGIPAGLVAARPGAVEDMWERRTGNSW